MIPGPGRLAAIAGLSLGGLLAVGALAERAWIARPAPRAGAAQATPGPVAPFLLAVVDGLRAERALPGPGSSMPFLASLAAEGASGIARTGEPTFTLACVRAILTGREPDPDAALRNFAGEAVEGDVVGFLLDRGAVAAHAGDATIAQLLRGRLWKDRVLAFPDRGPRDQGETDDLSVDFALRQVEAGVDVLTLHLVRPDHAGHRHGAEGEEYGEACRRSDEQLRRVVTAFRSRHPGATVLVAADHGLTRRGNHGGGEEEAVNAPFVLAGPAVARRADVRVEQTSLAPTVAALLGLPQPPHAQSPPETGLTTLPLPVRLGALDEHLGVRIAAARALGRLDEAAEADEARRAAAAAPPSEAQVSRLEESARRLAAGLQGRVATLVAVAILALATAWAALLASLASAGPLRAPPVAGWVAAGAFGFLVVAAAGRAVQDAFDAPGAAPRATALALVGAGLLAAAAVAWGGRRRLAEVASAHPGLLLLAGGVAIGFPLSLRPFVDPIGGGQTLTRDLVALAGLGAVAALAARSVGASRGSRRGLVLLAAAVLGGARVAEHLGGEGWALSGAARSGALSAAVALVGAGLAAHALTRLRTDRQSVVAAAAAFAAAAGYAARPDGDLGAGLWAAALAGALAAFLLARGGTPQGRLSARCLATLALARLLEPTDASALVVALACVGARLGGALSAPRTRAGLAGLAVALVAVRAALFHATGNGESLSTVDVGTGFLPRAFGVDPTPGTGVSRDVVLAVVLVSLRFALPWIAIFAACARAFERAGLRAGGRALFADLAVAYAARGAAVVLALSLWWRSVWWLTGARAVYLFAFAEILLAALAWAATAARASSVAREPGPLAGPGPVLAGRPVPSAAR